MAACLSRPYPLTPNEISPVRISSARADVTSYSILLSWLASVKPSLFLKTPVSLVYGFATNPPYAHAREDTKPSIVLCCMAYSHFSLIACSLVTRHKTIDELAHFLDCLFIGHAAGHDGGTDGLALLRWFETLKGKNRIGLLYGFLKFDLLDR